MDEIRLLLVEDDPAFSQIVKDSLELTGNYIVCVAKNGLEGYNAYKSFLPEIIVSDVEMPEMSGLEMVKQIRAENNNIPILLASARTNPRDLADGYKLEIDDYIKKPYLPAELELHIKAILRRVRKTEEISKEENGLYPLGSYLFNIKNYYLQRDTEQYELTVRETQILQVLCENKGGIVKRKDILQQFWGTDDFYTSRSLDVFVRKLRKYLEKDSAVQIITVRGEGLKLVF